MAADQKNPAPLLLNLPQDRISEPKAVWIPVIGHRGAGKSAFIATVTDNRAAITEEKASNDDAEFREYSFQCKDSNAAYEVHLVDVPSFTDDTVRNADIWTQLIVLLSLLEVCGRNLVSMIYMHDFENLALDDEILAENIEILDAILGPFGRNRCVIVPSLSTYFAAPTNRERLLFRDARFFGRMCKPSSEPILNRFDGSRSSARRIACSLIDSRFLPDVTAQIIGTESPPIPLGQSRAGKIIRRILEQATQRSEKRPLDLDRIQFIMTTLQQPPEQQAAFHIASEMERLETEHKENRAHREKVSKRIKVGGITTIALLPLIGIPIGMGWITSHDLKVIEKERIERLKIETLPVDVLNRNRRATMKELSPLDLDPKSNKMLGKLPLGLPDSEELTTDTLFDAVFHPDSSASVVATSSRVDDSQKASDSNKQKSSANDQTLMSRESRSADVAITQIPSSSPFEGSGDLDELLLPPTYEEATRVEQTPRYNQINTSELR